MAHKFEIHKDKAGEFRVRFKYNSETIFSTEGYASKSSAREAIESIKKNGPGAEVEETSCSVSVSVAENSCRCDAKWSWPGVRV
jgi:uncharacterized protein YegP (UPF0339 family)